MKKDSIINIRDLDFAYDSHPILKNVTFDILEGEYAAVIGPNGGGKTTLLKLMLGLLTPSKGTVRVFGLSPVAARKRIGYMAQHPRLDPDFPVTVFDVVLMGRLGHGRNVGPFQNADRFAAERALDEVLCLDCKDRAFSDLSTGLQQRVLIARALASEPDLLLLDEPASFLDPSIQEELQDLLHRLNEHLTLVVVSHDVGFVSRHVERVICVNQKVVLHPTNEISGETLSMLYGNKDLRFVDHDRHSHE